MKILLYGSTGMLGSDCLEVFKEEFDVIAPTHKEVDIISWDGVIDNLQRNKPHVIVNCAGFTSVDDCENDELTFMINKVNVEGPRNMAQGAARFESKMVHISSDYVFNGKKMPPQPYFEDDPPDPISRYGRTKAESEAAIRENAPDYIIVRTGWLYGLKGKNFIKSIIRQTVSNKRKTLKVVEDQIGTPTWTYSLAKQIKLMIKAGAKGTYHVTSEGYCTRFELAQYLIDKLNLKVKLKPCKSSEYPQKAKRPLNCILENRLLKQQGINIMPDWKQDLDLFLDKYGDMLIKEAKEGKSK